MWHNLFSIERVKVIIFLFYNYFNIYDGENPTVFWFDVSNTDTSGTVANPNHITGSRVHLYDGGHTTKEHYAEQFRASAEASSSFRVSRDGANVYLTASSIWSKHDATISGSISGIEHTSSWRARTSFAQRFLSASAVSSSFAGNRIENVVYLTASTKWGQVTTASITSENNTLIGLEASAPLFSYARTSIASQFQIASNNHGAFSSNLVEIFVLFCYLRD